MLLHSFVLLVCLSIAKPQEYDEIDLTATSGAMFKMLRDVANQTKADTLNLPANATSIRQNIVDNFTCADRIYGYYADVDNDCQIFHVCLPSQTPSGRNTTYRWSFICPNQTVFNQQVLVCTREDDSIDCEDAPMYYDINMEFGKIKNDTKENESTDDKSENQTDNGEINKKPEAQQNPTNPAEPKPTQVTNADRRKTQNNKRKQNIVIENLLNVIKNIETHDKHQGGEPFNNFRIEDLDKISPIDEDIEQIDFSKEVTAKTIKEDGLAMDRSFRRGRGINRGSLKFKADV